MMNFAATCLVAATGLALHLKDAVPSGVNLLTHLDERIDDGEIT